ncbi:D-alanyl-D-alanine dipeptidase [Rhodoferax koreense]|uniref:D-alanyl-D-alanine dipeptidase n=2 Tax=Rhodoferax koreensis TaxID=1842727 RepID=A0A1P8K2Z8_9BURK|nr:D-alanyl-D-alanine dipeptidase [Rhodoferax koreense]
MPHPLVQITPETHQVQLHLAYATPDNVAGQRIYDRAVCLLHRDAEACLRRAVALAADAGYRLKIFDAFRPHEAQVRLWETAPDQAYVADPKIGSNHTRGTAVDLTLVDGQGAELDMGTGFDDMTTASHHFSDAVSPVAQANRLLLMKVMEDAGFVHLPHEWWHYALPANDRYPLIDSALLGELSPMHLATTETATEG